MGIVQDVVKGVLSFSSDIVIVALLTAIFAAYALFLGKDRVVSLILSFYPSVLIFKALPYFKKLIVLNPSNFQDALIQVILFLIIFVPVNYVMLHIVSGEFSFSRVKKVFEAGILGLTATSLTILFSYHVINLQKMYNFSSGIDNLFTGTMFFWWLLIPFGVLLFLRK